MKIALTYVVLLVLLGGAVALALLVGHGNLADSALRSTLLGLRATRVGAALLVRRGKSTIRPFRPTISSCSTIEWLRSR